MARVLVEWAAAAVHDLDRIDDLLTARNESAAIELVEAVAVAIDSLARLPRRGRSPPELATLGLRGEYREIIISRYRLLYRLEGRRLLIVAFFDSRRDAEAFLQSRLVGRD